MAKKSTSPKVSKPTKNETVTIKKISNGYLAIKSGVKSNGDWFEETKYMKDNPIG